MKILIYTIPVAILVAYSQLVVKWRMQSGLADQVSGSLYDKFIAYFSDTYILSAYATALLSSFIWLMVIAKIPLSIGFPVYIGSTFLLVILGSWLWLGETVSLSKLLAVTLILSGIILGSLK